MTVPRFCMESICGWHLFQPSRLGYFSMKILSITHYGLSLYAHIIICIYNSSKINWLNYIFLITSVHHYHPVYLLVKVVIYAYLPTTTYSTDFTKWDRFFISGWPALTLASPSLARAQARRDRRRIGCAQRMKWARAPTRFGPGKYTRPNPTWACTQYTVWRLAWMLWTMCHLAGLARLALDKTGRAQLDHIQHHLNSSELI